MQLKTQEQVRAKVVQLVTHYNGLKPMDVVAMLDDEERALFSGTTLEKMVQEGELIEVEYTLPNDAEQIHSFLIPIGTEMNVRYAIAPEVQETTPVSIH
jgi:hypothetical protein